MREGEGSGVTTQTELRDGVFSRMDTFIETQSGDLDWVGTGADLAFADSVLHLGAWAERNRIAAKLEDLFTRQSRTKGDDETQTEFTMRLIHAAHIAEIVSMIDEM